ncbi:unnamed protein product [Heterobilharzia americana]|nr:unnamed protein product [Heterobilharzia americana]
MEIKIKNSTQTPTFWSLKKCNQSNGSNEQDNGDDVFSTTKTSGFLDSISHDGRQYLEMITVEFKPRKSGRVETMWKFEGILGEKTKVIQLVGTGTFDEYYHTI